MIDMTPFVLSFKLAFLTTLILFMVALPFAWWLSRTHARYKPLLEALTALPIVLPPSVLGFYLLVIFSPNSPVGSFIESLLGEKLVFTFTGLVVASCFYSLPFMVQPLQNGFESLNQHMIEASYLAGKSHWKTLRYVALPNIKPSLITALIITFAHTVGEFGVVLMVGGSIPGETKVASVAIYELVEIMAYDTAHIYAAILLGLSFLVLLGVYVYNHRRRKNLLKVVP
ncbi:MAG: molybdate ABC transporter permease subunit [Sulfurovum sp.]|nr:molybdate ABC transporter permease subunit [Sulfurovum sp.]MCB4750893.1 molybdate ABC transporter permease subunit [Sulfurovum sp.]MCB4760069.1 molybdate ABC transporter permease subunit [Sulfurovum sp.]MCB4776648.1 molybdate ABC transporter permease subunit [Sulfurovum sp.]MCB4781727.1 molybdate ABC transporter permease subunit [Sulfurovum sp.]